MTDALRGSLREQGLRLVSGDTDNHRLLVDLDSPPPRRDGERHSEGLGGPLSAESNQIRAVEQKYRAKGHTRKADNIQHNNLGHQTGDRRRSLPRKQVYDYLCQAVHAFVAKVGTLAGENLSMPVKSAKYRHRDTNRRLHGWIQGVMADTPTSQFRCRGSGLALVNPAGTSHIDSRTGLLPGTRRWDRFYCLDGVARDTDTNVACTIPGRLYDAEATLCMPDREMRALLAERTRTGVGTARPGLELRGLAIRPPSTESEVPGIHKV